LAQLEHIEAIEKRLWNAADTLRANSNYASNEYFLPVMGLIFLRHAYSRFLTAKEQIEQNLPKRGGKRRAITKEDFSQKSAIFLHEKARFDYLVSLSDRDNRAASIIEAMELIEKDYSSLRDVLPKNEYQELDNEVLGQLLRALNPEELKKISGDIFGRIYEYFLTQFADQKAHDGGEFFTPVSLVSLIAHIIDPKKGTLIDPACGSGGMFVQSAKTVEERGENPIERLTFYGLEKNATTIRLAKMNLAVHGLEGDIKKAITYYDDPHKLNGKADFVMANPPFNVDEIDADKIKKDPRLSFGLPGVNKNQKVSNGNYIWISYFHSYLNNTGRAGFVMSSQASSAGRDEAKVRRKLIESGDVDIMVAIRSNFFYTRSVPCELWFLNKNKPENLKNKVLMIDARNIYRKVTRKIFDFSPEQEQNILSIVWLYRNEKDKFLELVKSYCLKTIENGKLCFVSDEDYENKNPLPLFSDSVENLYSLLNPFIKSVTDKKNLEEPLKEFNEAFSLFKKDIKSFENEVKKQKSDWNEKSIQIKDLTTKVLILEPLKEKSKGLVKQTDLIFKLLTDLIETLENQYDSKADDLWKNSEITKAKKAVDILRSKALDQLKEVRYFWKQANWLTKRFPDGKLKDVEGLVKLVDKKEIEKNDWSLTPGRYVGVAPEEEDEDFDFEAVMREIHMELEDLNAEAVELAGVIKKNFEGLGI
jgi:type I restriction enzyme M protein